MVVYIPQYFMTHIWLILSHVILFIWNRFCNLLPIAHSWLSWWPSSLYLICHCDCQSNPKPMQQQLWQAYIMSCDMKWKLSNFFSFPFLLWQSYHKYYILKVLVYEIYTRIPIHLEYECNFIVTNNNIYLGHRVQF